MNILIFLAGLVVGVVITAFLTKNNATSQSVYNIDDVIELNKKITELETKNAQYQEASLKEDEIQKRFMTEFENIANKILKENTTEFSKTNQKELNDLLKPFREQIDGFQKKVDENTKETLVTKNTLEAQIKFLGENSQKICEEAKNLTLALRGQNKTQGDWGEIILKRVLELSGLKENEEYSLQETLSTGGRPDVIIKLPENKHIIVDSKVSLVSYEKYFNSDDEQDKNTHIKAFIDSVKYHIKSLGEKNYFDAQSINSPDFVLLFIPIEGCFNLILSQDNELLNFAWEKRIMLVSPSTLLASLKTINLFWTQDRQNKNVIEIAKESGNLYDKFVGFIDDLKTVQASFVKAQSGFDGAFNKLSEGKGNIIKRIENLKKLGAKATKQLSSDILDAAEEEEEVIRV